MRSALFGLLVMLCTLLANCIGYYQYVERVHYAELRANESARAVDTVRKLGEAAEAQYRQTGRLPTAEDLNCDVKPCKAYTFITREVSLGADGTVLAKYHKLGVPFSPSSDFVVQWDSRSRATDRDAMTQPWQWKMSYVPWLLVSVGLVALPWLPATYRAIKRFRIGG